MMIYRNDPRFGFVRIIELLQIRECQRGEDHDARWYELAVEATTMDDIEEWVDGFLKRTEND